MRSFRFPRFAIFLMLATFLVILTAIGLAREMASTVTRQMAGPDLPAVWWSRLPLEVLWVFMIFWGIGALGYGILFALRRTGIHRFPDIEIWSGRRQ